MPFVLEFLAIGLRVCYDIVSYFTNKFAWNFMVRLAEFQSSVPKNVSMNWLIVFRRIKLIKCK